MRFTKTAKTFCHNIVIFFTKCKSSNIKLASFLDMLTYKEDENIATSWISGQKGVAIPVTNRKTLAIIKVLKWTNIVSDRPLMISHA